MGVSLGFTVSREHVDATMFGPVMPSVGLEATSERNFDLGPLIVRLWPKLPEPKEPRR